MRIRVDTRFGYVSFDISEAERAYDFYLAEGVRLSICDDLFDVGAVLVGLPHGVDFSRRLEVVN